MIWKNTNGAKQDRISFKKKQILKKKRSIYHVPCFREREMHCWVVVIISFRSFDRNIELRKTTTMARGSSSPDLAKKDTPSSL